MRTTEYTPSAIPLQSLLFLLKNGEVIKNNDYQRDFIWKNSMKEELILTIFENMPIGTITIWDNGINKELIDGFQRVSTIESFVNDEIILPYIFSKKLIEMFKDELITFADESKNTKKILKSFNDGKKIRLNYSMLPRFLKNRFESYLISTTEIRYADIFKIRNYFRKVQNQEQLKAGEIINSIPENDLVKEIKDVDLKLFSSILGFDNSRSDLMKLIINFHGIYERKLALNISEKKIINYVKNNDEINLIFKNRLILLKNDLKNVRISKKIKTKMGIKLLFMMRLLSINFDFYELEEIIAFIHDFISNTKIINSNKAESFDARRKIMEEYPEKYELSIIFKGQHSSKAVYNLMPTLEKVVKKWAKGEYRI